MTTAATVIKIGPVRQQDVSCVKKLMEEAATRPFLQERRNGNVDGTPPTFSREHFWYVLTGCLLTTQQRSTRGSAVSRFLDAEPYPLELSRCKPGKVDLLVQTEIARFGGIRRGLTIARQADANFQRLTNGEWLAVEKNFQKLLEQRKRVPVPSDKAVERAASRWAADTFAGIGPKQSRNLWQWLGLTRYETPLDSRVVGWINDNLSVEVSATQLPDRRYYEAALDYLQAICDAAGVLPCLFDAAAFRYEGEESTASAAEGATTHPGYVNRHGQVVIRNTGLPGTDHLQFIYQIGCSLCGHAYGANGSDIHERLCPRCQGGRPGLSFTSVQHA